MQSRSAVDEGGGGKPRSKGRALRLLVGLLGLGMTIGAYEPASAEPVACQRAIAREAAKLSQAQLAAFVKCEQAVFAGKAPLATDCRSDPATLATRAKAEEALVRGIAKACGGGNKTCKLTDTGADADDPLAAIGWDLGACPNFENNACTNTLTDCGDVATCLVCVSDVAVEQALDLYAGSLTSSEPGSKINRCQIAISKEAARFFAAKSKAIQRCEDQVLRGKIAGPCPDSDAKTLAAIQRADAKKRDKICKACGGDDGACGGADDLTLAEIGFPARCPAVALGSASCGGAVATLPDLVACVDCVTEFKADCLDALSVPGLKGYPAGCVIMSTPTPTATSTPTPTLTPTPTPTQTPPAGPAAIKCERTIVKEAARLAQTRVRELARCREDKQKGKLPPAADCLVDSKAGPRIAQAEQQLSSQIGKACGGGNRACGAGDTGADADLALSLLGWDLPSCPGFEDAPCTNSITDCNDIAGCVRCVHASAVDQAIALAFASASPAGPATPLGKCQLSIGRATADLLLARSLALQKCADATLKGRVAGPCPDPGDGKAAPAIAKAEDRLVSRICMSCGGSDGFCGGGDDLSPASLGFPPSCPDVRAPGAKTCGGPLASLEDLVGCLACVSAFKGDCVDQIAIPGMRGYGDACGPGGGVTPTPTAAGATPTAPTPTPTPSGPVCGNGIKEKGEDCDDGNTSNCDTCPANCRTAPPDCTGSGHTTPQTVRLRPPAFQSLTSANFCLDYPAGTVGFTGTGLVTGRLSGFAGLTSVNDFNNAVQISLVGRNVLSEIDVTLSLDLCAGATAPPPTAFDCTVISASNAGTSLDPSRVECTPVGP